MGPGDKIRLTDGKIDKNIKRIMLGLDVNKERKRKGLMQTTELLVMRRNLDFDQNGNIATGINYNQYISLEKTNPGICIKFWSTELYFLGINKVNLSEGLQKQII